MNKNEIGTLDWARTNGGRLTADERDAFLRTVVEVQAKQMAAASTENRERLSKVNFDSIPVPDTKIAESARQYAEEVSSEAVLNHCLRTYYWGALFAQIDDVVIDDWELFYVASVLHDLAATETHHGKDAKAHCFAVESAFAASETLNKSEFDAKKTELIAEAISLHINSIVEVEYGPTAYCLHAGAHCDIVGRRIQELLLTRVSSEVLKHYPCLDIRQEWKVFIEKEIAIHPDSRVGVLLADAETMPDFCPWVDHQ